MGNINNEHKEFLTVRIGLQDLFKADDNAIAYLLASLGVYFLNKAAPDLAKQIRDDETIAKWAFDNGEFLVAIGKKGTDAESVKGAVFNYIKEYKMAMND